VPDLPALMRRVHARLEADPASPPGAPARVGGFVLQMIAGALIKNPNTLAMLPRVYAEADQGRLGGVAPYAAMLAAPGVQGMPEAMDLASGVSPGKLAQVRSEAETAVLGDALNFPMPHLLGAVPGVDLGDDFRARFETDTPALLVAGSLDGRTPLAEQAEVAGQFTRKAQLMVENGGHDVFEAHPEVTPMLVRFFKGERLGDARLTLPPVRFQPV
jgi:pimeloyl-ACP methyl ester carboxylesterase